jgi:ANTAR domain-containing protein
MSATIGPHADGDSTRAAGRPLTPIGENLVRLAVPPGTPEEARATIQRLVELTSILARRSAQLQGALDSRVAIEQAKGIVAERYSVSLDHAFQILRSAARSNRMRLHDVAARVTPAAETPPEVCAAVLKSITRGVKTG